MIAKVGARVRQVPPAVWVGTVLLVAIACLAWDRYNRDDDDADWTTPKETQPPPEFRGIAAHGTGRPMECGPAFRGRAFPGSLVDASFSLVRDCC